jgi:hypothetical protein
MCEGPALLMNEDEKEDEKKIAMLQAQELRRLLIEEKLNHEEEE